MFPRPASRGRAERGPPDHPKEDPAPTDHTRPLLGAALSVDTATVAASPSRPVLPTDHKPGGSSCLSPATRRRPASVTAADGKDPAPPYRGPGDLSPPCPRGARTAGLASPSVVDRTVRSVITDGARNDRPAWPGPPKAVQIKERRTENQQPSQGSLLLRREAKGHQPGEGRRTPRSCTADAARKREDGQPRQRSSPARPSPPGRA